MHHLVQTNWTVSLWRDQTWTRTDSSHQCGYQLLILIHPPHPSSSTQFSFLKHAMWGIFSLTHQCEISCDGSFWCCKKKKKKSMINSNPNDLPCTFNFMGLVASKIPPLLVWYCKYSIFSRRAAEKHTDDCQNNIVFNNETLRDDPAEISFELEPIINTLPLEFDMKYGVAPTNVSLYASSLFVLHYITQRSGTTYHSFIN